MFAEQIDALFAEAANTGAFSGVLVVAREDETVFARAAGCASRVWRVPNRLDTRFRVASIGKMFTAVAVCRLIDQGRLKLEDRVVELLGLEGTRIPREVTVHHLLTMTAGIADWLEESEDVAAAWEELRRGSPIYLLRENRDYLPLFANKPPRASVGERHRYSNASYILLGLAIERVAGETYADHVRSQVFEPAGMARTGLSSVDDVEEEVAEGYVSSGGGWRKNLYELTPGAASDGGATSTTADLLAFLRALRGGRLLSPAMTRALLTPKVADGDQPCRGYNCYYGYGNMFLTDQQGEVVRYGHTGEEPGVSCRLWSYPRLGLDVVILGNQSEVAGPLGWAVHELVTA